MCQAQIIMFPGLYSLCRVRCKQLLGESFRGSNTRAASKSCITIMNLDLFRRKIDRSRKYTLHSRNEIFGPFYDSVVRISKTCQPPEAATEGRHSRPSAPAFRGRLRRQAGRPQTAEIRPFGDTTLVKTGTPKISSRFVQGIFPASISRIYYDFDVAVAVVPFLLTHKGLYPILFQPSQERVSIKGLSVKTLLHFKGSSTRFFNLAREDKFPE